MSSYEIKKTESLNLLLKKSYKLDEESLVTNE